MNTRCQNSLLLFFVGLVWFPLLVVSESNAASSFQGAVPGAGGDQVKPKDDKKKSDSQQEKSTADDPLSASRFNPEPTSVFLAPPREFIRPLTRAIRIHNEGDHVHAAELIGQFLVDLGEEDFLIFNDKAKGTAVSVSSIANEMLAALPESAMEAYRVRFGVPARQRLSLAIAESNYFEIAQVKQRFLHTDAGFEATVLLGHHHFDAGRVLLAAESFQTALDLAKRQGKLDAKLSVLTAVSWVLARRSEFAETVMRDLANANGGKFRIGDQDVAIDDASPLKSINAFVGAGPLDSSAAVDQWLLVGGNARRNATTVGGFPVGQPLWEVDVDASREDLQRVKSNRDRIASDTSSAATSSLVPASVPLIVDGLVLVGNKNKIQAVDFSTGKRVWAVKSGAGVFVGSKETLGIGLRAQIQIQIGQQQGFGGVGVASASTTDRYPWSDFLQGHASSDGKFIFRVVKSAAAPSTSPPGRIRFGGMSSSMNASKNKLQAIDVLKEGELAWEAGGGETTGDPRLTQVDFLGAPLPVDGVLYAIGKRLEEVVLVALSSLDGELLWMQSLASDENLSRSRYQRPSASKENLSLRPSYSDGILVCPTGKNALVAIDAVGRRLLWGMQTTVGSSPRTTSSSQAAKLQNPQVFIENSRIIAFDISNDPRLLAMDLLDGSPLMKIGKAGVLCRDVLYVASVDEDQVVLVEKKRVRAISSDSGRKTWETSIADYGSPTGRGYVSEVVEDGEVKHALYLPTEGNVIIKLDIDGKGKVVDGIQADRTLGNLIVHQGRVISRRETSVACFELDSKVVADLNAAAEKSGGFEQLTPTLKIKQAALLRNQGNPRKAIQLLETIDAGDRSDRFKVEFLQNATLMFDSDPEFALKLFKDHESWFKYETNPKLFLGYVELLVENNLVDDMLKQVFEDDSFFTPVDPALETRLLQRPIGGYDFPDSDKPAVGEGEAGNGGGVQDKGDDNAFGDSDDDGESLEEKPSPFLESQKKFSKNKISFDPNHWAKTQLIRTVREFPKSKEKVQTAIENRLRSTDVSDVVQRHRLFRQFPLELISPELRFELAKQLIAKEHVAEAESMLASLVGFLPSEVNQIKAVEGGPSKDALVALWQNVRNAQFGAQTEAVSTPDNAQATGSKGFERVEVNAIRVASQYQQDYPTRVEARGDLMGQMLKDKRLVIWGYGQEMELLDANGESETRFTLFEESPDSRMNLRSGNGWIKANHSVAVLRQKNLVLAMDLSKLEHGQSSVLWYKNVIPRRSSRTEVADEMDLIISNKLQVEDVVASFPATGCCCFIANDKLVCVDAFTGKTLWSRNKNEKHMRVLGNENQVVTMDSKQADYTVFDVRTGERLRTNEISKLTELLWSVDGMSFLSSSASKSLDVLKDVEDLVDYRPTQETAAEAVEEENGEKDKKQKDTSKVRVLSRYDLVAGEFVWKKVFADRAKVCRLAGGRFLVLSDDNQFYIFDTNSGKQLAKMPSGLTEEQRQKIQFVGAREHLGQDLVALATAKSSIISSPSYRIRTSRSLSTFFSGHLLLLTRGDVKPVWSRPAEVSGFSLLPMLPTSSPLLLFNRSIQSSRVTNNPKPADPPIVTSGSFQLLGIDMRTGKVAVNKIFPALSSIRFNSPIVDPVARTIELKFSGLVVKLSMKEPTDEPPAPVASVTKDNPVPRNHNAELPVAKVAGGEFDVEKVNERLVRQAEEYEASLEQSRANERALLESESGPAR